MTEPTNRTPGDEPKADETFTWTNEPPRQETGQGSGASTAAAILESVRDAVDELAERAAPTVRELSARAAELTAIAAARAAPLAKRAGEATADASGKLATKSREWASELRASVTGAGHDASDPGAPAATQDAGAPAPTQDAGAPAPTPGFEPVEGAREPEEPSQG